MNEKVQLLESVLMAVLNRALNADGLPVAVVRLALADALHTVRELERQLDRPPAADKTTPKKEADDGKPPKTD